MKLNNLFIEIKKVSFIINTFPIHKTTENRQFTTNLLQFYYDYARGARFTDAVFTFLSTMVLVSVALSASTELLQYFFLLIILFTRK